MAYLGSRLDAEGEPDFLGIRVAWAKTPYPESVKDLSVANVVALSREDVALSNYGIALATVDGLPVVAYCAPGVSIAIPSARDKLAESWEQISLRSAISENVGLCLCGDSLYLLSLESHGSLMLGQCAIGEIKQPDSWRWSLVDRNVRSYAFSIAAVGDRPAVAYRRSQGTFPGGSLDVAIAKVAHPRSPRDWWKYRLGESTIFMTLAEVNGKPAIGYLSPYAICYAYATRPDPRSRRDWQVTKVFEDQAFTSEKRAYDRMEFDRENQYTLRGILTNPVACAFLVAALFIVSTAFYLGLRLRRRR